MKQPFKVFSTFTGIGGFEIGIRNAANGLPVEFVGYSEIDKPAISVYERHFKGVHNYGDITKIEASELPDFDCLVGGFPCQAFSIAGRRAGFDDTRGTLFFDLARILRAKRPRLFVFENVKGLVNHDAGRTLKTIVATIDELGYDCQWQVLNSKNHGVPQNRERIIIVGHIRGTARPQVFPIDSGSREVASESAEVRAVTQTLVASYYKGGKGSHIQTLVPVQLTETRTDEAKEIRRQHMQAGRDFSPRRGKILIPRNDQIANTVTATQGRERFILVPEATKKGYAEAHPGQSVNLSHLNSKTRRGRVADISPTLETSPQIHTVTYELAVRKLTPLECERLQAFPDNWTEYGVEHYTDNHGLLQQRLKPTSDSQRYKMCGNAVTTNVIEAVFKQIFASNAA